MDLRHGGGPDRSGFQDSNGTGRNFSGGMEAYDRSRLEPEPATSSLPENERQDGNEMNKRRNGITPGHIAVGFMVAVAIGNVMTLRKRLLHIERLNNAAHEAGRQRQRVRTAQEEYVRAKARQESERRAQAEAEEEIRRQTRYQHMRNEEDKERDRFRRAYARWQRQSQQHQQQEQQHQYWDGQSFGHGWSEEEANRRKWQHQSGSRSGAATSAGSGRIEHWDTLGLERRREQPFSPAEIKAAFRAKALEYHPDRNPENSEEAAKQFRKVLDAYHALTGQHA